jgi:glucosamine kinase
MLVTNVNGKFNSMSEYIIAVDGGGTKCKATLYSLNGQKLASAITGPANIFSDFGTAIASILDAAHKVTQEAGISLEQCALSAGCAGAGIPAAVTQFEQWQHPFARLFLMTDIHASCLAANEGQDCVLIILGTGSCVATIVNEELSIFGGHGFMLGDIGSGAWIGRELITWYLQSIDGLQPDSLLAKAMMQTVGDSPSKIIEHYAKASAGEFAVLAKIAFAHQQQSPIARSILNKGRNYVVSMVSKKAPDTSSVFVDGGLSDAYLPMLESALAKEIHRPIKSAEFGAYLHAKSVLSHEQKTA